MFVHYLTHAEPLFRKLNILNIYDLCKIQILIFVYKSDNNLLPPICTNYFTHAKDVQLYIYTQLRTRSSKNSNLYRINAYKSCRINSIAVRGPKFWNLLPVSISKSIWCPNSSAKRRSTNFFAIYTVLYN